VVAETYVRYKAPAFYEDELIIRTKIAEVRSRSIRFVYEIYRPSDDTLIAEGETLHLSTGTDKKVRIIPEHYRAKLLSDEEREEFAFPANHAPS
jgi:acyl-CoA thioester hydrolase